MPRRIIRSLLGFWFEERIASVLVECEVLSPSDTPNTRQT